MQLQAGCGRGETVEKIGQRRLHVEGDEQRPRGIVFVRDGSTEEHEQRVSGVLGDEAVVALGDRRHARDDRRDDLVELLGVVELLRERREAGDVGEERGDQSSFFGPVRLRVERALYAAPSTEPGAVRVLTVAAAAPPTAHGTKGTPRTWEPRSPASTFPLRCTRRSS